MTTKRQRRQANFGKGNTQKATTPRFRHGPSWRAAMRADGIRRWKIRRAIAAATAELEELERAS